MENELQLKPPNDHDQVEIDIRKILVQLGLNQEHWPIEWRTAVQRTNPN